MPSSRRRMDATTRAAEIRSAVTALEDRVPLGISGLRLCRKVLGFGAFEPLEGPELKPGQNILIYCEPTGLRFETRETHGWSPAVVAHRARLGRRWRKVWEQ